MLSASLRSPKPAGVRQPATDHGQMAASERHPVRQGHHSHLAPDVPSEHMERATPTGGVERPSRRPATPRRRPAAHNCQTDLNLDGVDGHAEQEALAVSPGRPGGVVPSGPRPRPEARPGSRFGHRRGVAGLVAVCVLALGVAACSVKDAKAEASASASASASAAIARAEKGIADANASATASREAALTPELRAKRDAALAEPAPAKPPQMNEESAEGAAASVGYFLNLYRYAFMTGKTNEVDSMSENGCVFCKSVIDRANQLHKDGGWADKWDQDITNVRYYDKLEGYDYSRIEATINYGEMTSYSGGSWEKSVAPPTEGQKVRFAIRYVNGGWAIREGEVLQ